jgi:5-methylcytosine-specific restriction endonuclease McrA
VARRLLDWASRRKRAGRRRIGDAKAKGNVVATIQREAEKHDATLENDGKGGIDPAIALKVFRRDKWRCSNKKCPTPKKDITLDHISSHASEIFDSPASRNNAVLTAGAHKGHVDEVEALHTLCAACHDRVHQRERAIAENKSPPPMRGWEDDEVA